MEIATSVSSNGALNWTTHGSTATQADQCLQARLLTSQKHAHCAALFNLCRYKNIFYCLQFNIFISNFTSL